MITIPRSPKSSNMSLSQSREEWVNTGGTVKTLYQLIENNNINIDTAEIMNSMPIYVMYFTENQAIVFKAYYWRQMSINDIRMQYRFRSLCDVDRTLKSATNKYIKLLKADYGVKE